MQESGFPSASQLKEEAEIELKKFDKKQNADEKKAKTSSYLIYLGMFVG